MSNVCGYCRSEGLACGEKMFKAEYEAERQADQIEGYQAAMSILDSNLDEGQSQDLQ